MKDIRPVADENFISRPALAARWGCHVETLKRKEKAGILHPIELSGRLVRYRLSEILQIEGEAEKRTRGSAVAIPGRFVSRAKTIIPPEA